MVDPPPLLRGDSLSSVYRTVHGEGGQRRRCLSRPSTHSRLCLLVEVSTLLYRIGRPLEGGAQPGTARLFPSPSGRALAIRPLGPALPGERTRIEGPLPEPASWPQPVLAVLDHVPAVPHAMVFAPPRALSSCPLSQRSPGERVVDGAVKGVPEGHAVADPPVGGDDLYAEHEPWPPGLPPARRLDPESRSDPSPSARRGLIPHFRIVSARRLAVRRFALARGAHIRDPSAWRARGAVEAR